MGNVFWGLDMGTNSVGWAVTDEHYNLLRAKGKDLWGARLFDRADTAEERRGHRIARRRRARQVARVAFLKEVFCDEISKVDPGFYNRMEESKYHFEDRSEDNKQRYAIFADSDYTDKDYFSQYPTIFHLRKELLESSCPHDVRLVYLALLNMFSRRGNFLNESLSSDDTNSNIKDAYLTFVDEAVAFDILFNEKIDASALETLLGEKGLSKSRICENICKFFEVTKKDKEKYALIQLMCGMTAKIIDIYGPSVVDSEHKTLSICFRDSNYEEKETETRECVGDEFYSLIEATKTIHDIGLLSNIMKGKAYLTLARVESYEKHRKDLLLLKKVLKKYNKDAYESFFRTMESGNYSGYVGSVNSDKIKIRRGYKTSQADLYKTIKKILSDCPQDDADIKQILSDISNEQFLPKQLTADNGVIPNQEYVREMKKILANAETYLPFLNEKDETGLTVSEKIVQMFSFHMPYYVGPIGQEYLDKKGYNTWARRIAPGKVYPWNLDEKIDTKEAAEKFIERMVRHCTYLSNEKTLPKCSILYERFMVLNELNNLKVKGEAISVETKQDIFNQLFWGGKKVSVSKLEGYFVREGIVAKEDKDFLSGIDVEGGFKSSLSSIGKFYSVLKDEVYSEKNMKMMEDIIFWATVYGNDKKYISQRIRQAYGDRLSDSEIKKILGFRFDGWSNLSKEFLEMRGSSYEDKDRSIIQALWETNSNLSKLLGGDYSYRDELDSRIGSVEKSLSEWTIEDIDDLYLSAPVKRMVWQTIKLTSELEQVTQKTPDRIFVEMAREDGEKGVRKASRKKKLLELYSAIKSDEKSWVKEIGDKNEADFRNRKLYLYYTQMGRCMYSGETIDLEKLLADNTEYDIDHIYPRHFVKDDSIENNLVLVKKGLNGRKSDIYPINAEIRGEMSGFWKSLLQKGMISAEKYQRLIRQTGFSDEERAGFVSRQLVETRQGTKVITQILKQAFPKSEIVFSKASEVSDFRNTFDLVKVRCINDYHHAQDAYLNIVVGNTYYSKFTSNPLNFVREAAKHGFSGEYAYNMGKIFLNDVIRKGEIVWKAPNDKLSEAGSIATVKRILSKNSVLITKRAYIAHGGITGKDTVYGKDVATPGTYIPMSSDARLTDVTKYGGRTSVSNMCYALIAYKVKGKEVLSLEALPIFLGYIKSISDECILQYLSKALTMENGSKPVSDIRIIKRCIRYGTKIRLDGFDYYIAGKSLDSIYMENTKSLIMSKTDSVYIKKIEKALNTDFYGEKEAGEIIINKDRNVHIYDELAKKISGPTYSMRKNSVSKIVCGGREKFVQLTVKEQCSVIMQLIIWLQIGCYTIDLSLIGGGTKVGFCRANKKITSVSEFVLIYESVTGLIEYQEKIV